MKLLFYVTEDWYFLSHRLPLAQAAMNEGYEVVLVTNITSFRSEIEKYGVRVIPFSGDRKSINPFNMALQVLKLKRVIAQEKPDLLHLVSLKPMLIGGLAALNIKSVKVVNTLTGLGWSFSSKKVIASTISKVLSVLLKRLLRESDTIVQNEEDYQWLIALGVPENKVKLIKGSGVDVKVFLPSKSKNKVPVVTCAARMIVEKGILDFIDAAKILKRRGVAAKFQLIGSSDAGNRSAVPEAYLIDCQEKGYISWLGHRTDIAELLQQSDIACLPSFYREGVPKVLLEAAAVGLPIVTTDWVGCREVVQHGHNGVLVPIKNPVALADALEEVILNVDKRQRMGEESRKMVLEGFTLEQVINQTLYIYKALAA